mmetsp:Transcript_18807/g.44064  ORF Transcript_18807/g.44064 Transcript_18807/m.44064 type:complete len:610 (-) Transcript_18807:98-1927(-)
MRFEGTLPFPYRLLLFAVLPVLANSQAVCKTVETVCKGKEDFSFYPMPGCIEYAECKGGEAMRVSVCGDGTIFDSFLSRCETESLAYCTAESCEPTLSPSDSPTFNPTKKPTPGPSNKPSTSPTIRPTYEPTNGVGFDFMRDFDNFQMMQRMQDVVLQSYNPSGIAYPSTMYTFAGLVDALDLMAMDGITSDGRLFKLYISDPTESRMDYAFTNLAAFLAMAMTDAIEYDTCDEVNDEMVADRYAITNSCGQNLRSYQDEVCLSAGEIDYSCPVDLEMDVVSSSHSTGIRGRHPPPFFCRPKKDENDFAGYWDRSTGMSSNSAYGNALGRTDTEGCCWWGRGATLTKGVCNIGKLNYFLGKRAHEERGEGLFRKIDFCKQPGATCEMGTEDIRWIVAMFEWIERIQNYDGGWNYMPNLKRFVRDGLKDDSFIDTVSSIFVRGCHKDRCSRSKVTKKERRRENFYRVLTAMQVKSLTPPPTLAPTFSLMPVKDEQRTPSPVISIKPGNKFPPAQSNIQHASPSSLGTDTASKLPTIWLNQRPSPKTAPSANLPVLKFSRSEKPIDSPDSSDVEDALILMDGNPAFQRYAFISLIIQFALFVHLNNNIIRI